MQKPADCIHLAEEFTLFSPERTETYYFAGDIAQLFSDVCLVTALLEPLPITIFKEFHREKVLRLSSACTTQP